METYKDRHSCVPTQITHYRRCAPSSPPRSSLSHTQKRLLVFSPPGPALFSISAHPAGQKSWDNLARSKRWNYSLTLCRIVLHTRFTAWLDFPPTHTHTCLLSNATHTSLKKHCHRLLASSIFPFWHFLLSCLEHESQQQRSKGTFSLLFSAIRGENNKAGFLFYWQTYWVASLCRESTVRAVWYRYSRITELHSKLLAIINYVASLNNTRGVFALLGALKMKCLFR